MKIKLENREYEFIANGKFLLKYQETFNENLVVALYKVAMEKDPLTCAKIVYCGINEEQPFEEWIDSFETPLFTSSGIPHIRSTLNAVVFSCFSE